MRWTFIPHVCLVQFGKPQRLEWYSDLGTPALVMDMGFSLPDAVPTLIDSTPATGPIVFNAKIVLDAVGIYIEPVGILMVVIGV